MNQSGTNEEDEDYHYINDEIRKQAVADALFHYSTIVMTCIELNIQPCHLRLYLMKEISGLNKYSNSNDGG